MKKLIIFLMTMVLCFGLTACGGQQATVSPANPLGFNPNNPEGWSVEAQDKWQDWSDWMTSKGLPISGKDYSVGDFSLGMSLKKAAKYFSAKPFSETEEDNGSYIEQKVTLNSLVLCFIKSDNHPSVSLREIDITGKKYATPRGLRVGDSAEKLYELYGIPASVSKNVWTFACENETRENFYVTVVNGVVEKIRTTNIAD